MNNDIRKQIEAAADTYAGYIDDEDGPSISPLQKRAFTEGAEFGLGLASEETKRVVSQWQSASIEWGKERGALAARVKDYEQQIRDSVLCGRDKATFHELRNERDKLREALKLHGDDYVKQVGTWKINQRLEEERDQALREIADE